MFYCFFCGRSVEPEKLILRSTRRVASFREETHPPWLSRLAFMRGQPSEATLLMQERPAVCQGRRTGWNLRNQKEGKKQKGTVCPYPFAFIQVAAKRTLRDEIDGSNQFAQFELTMM
jgi:hypothetical protein